MSAPSHVVVGEAESGLLRLQRHGSGTTSQWKRFVPAMFCLCLGTNGMCPELLDISVRPSCALSINAWPAPRVMLYLVLVLCENTVY